jgi:hypothetical protein
MIALEHQVIEFIDNITESNDIDGRIEIIEALAVMSMGALREIFGAEDMKTWLEAVSIMLMQPLDEEVVH